MCYFLSISIAMWSVCFTVLCEDGRWWIEMSITWYNTIQHLPRRRLVITTNLNYIVNWIELCMIFYVIVLLRHRSLRHRPSTSSFPYAQNHSARLFEVICRHCTRMVYFRPLVNWSPNIARQKANIFQIRSNVDTNEQIVIMFDFLSGLIINQDMVLCLSL